MTKSLRTLLTIAVPLVFSAQAVVAQDNGPIATGQHASGEVVAEIDGMVPETDRVTIKMTLRPTQEGSRVSPKVIYSGLNGNVYEEIYLLAGDTKYMLLRDDGNNVIASRSLVASGSGPSLGVWYGVFPMPDPGEAIMLFMPNMQPIGPFTMQAR
ncbi:hypothetical protein ACMA5I_13730 [Paracoccaceae bacterium GXU_MW_L88]